MSKIYLYHSCKYYMRNLCCQTLKISNMFYHHLCSHILYKYTLNSHHNFAKYIQEIFIFFHFFRIFKTHLAEFQENREKNRNNFWVLKIAKKRKKMKKIFLCFSCKIVKAIMVRKNSVSKIF